MDTIKKIKLLYPILVSEKDGKKEVVEELTFGRLKTKHLRLLPSDFMQKAKIGDIEPASLIPVIAGLANISEKIADEIDISDLTLIMEEIKDFFGDFLTATGKN